MVRKKRLVILSFIAITALAIFTLKRSDKFPFGLLSSDIVFEETPYNPDYENFDISIPALQTGMEVSGLSKMDGIFDIRYCEGFKCAKSTVCINKANDLDAGSFYRIKLLGESNGCFNYEVLYLYDISIIKSGSRSCAEKYKISEKEIINRYTSSAKKYECSIDPLPSIVFKTESGVSYQTAGDPYVFVEGITGNLMYRDGGNVCGWGSFEIGCSVGRNLNVKKLYVKFNEPSSFTGNTLVLSNKGKIKISALKINDTLTSYDITNNKFMEATIVNLRRRLVDKITVINGDIETTERHPFGIYENNNIIWKEVGDLKTGDKMFSNLLQNVEVSSIETRIPNEKVEVYNLELTYPHNYFVIVNSLPVLVHNKY